MVSHTRTGSNTQTGQGEQDQGKSKALPEMIYFNLNLRSQTLPANRQKVDRKASALRPAIRSELHEVDCGEAEVKGFVEGKPRCSADGLEPKPSGWHWRIGGQVDRLWPRLMQLNG